jgi:hypothetical protein
VEEESSFYQTKTSHESNKPNIIRLIKFGSEFPNIFVESGYNIQMLRIIFEQLEYLFEPSEYYSTLISRIFDEYEYYS